LVGLIVLYAAATVLVSGAPAMARQVTRILRNYTIVIDDDLVVRRLHPLPMFDEKGKPKRPTAEELRKMKGTDPKLKGYMAERADLKPGQVVVVTLARAKASASKAKADSGESGSGKSKKPAYTIVGEYTGRLVRAPVSNANPKVGKDGQEEKASVVVGFDSLRLPGQPAPAPRDKTRLPPTIFVLRIMIVADG
jgi:hypothetical protein